MEQKLKKKLKQYKIKKPILMNCKKNYQSLKKDLMIEGKELTNLRKKWAQKLTKAIHNELKELYMQKTVFEVKFESGENYISKSV